jgi:hypothetical protein
MVTKELSQVIFLRKYLLKMLLSQVVAEMSSSIISHYHLVAKISFVTSSHYHVVTQDVPSFPVLNTGPQNQFHHPFPWLPFSKHVSVFSTTTWSPPTGEHSDSRLCSIKSSPPSHSPLPDLYKGFCTPPKTLTLKMATVLFAETLENVQH